MWEDGHTEKKCGNIIPNFVSVLDKVGNMVSITFKKNINMWEVGTYGSENIRSTLTVKEGSPDWRVGSDVWLVVCSP